MQYLDVQLDPAALQQMLKFSKGARQVPVIVENGRAQVGYGGKG